MRAEDPAVRRRSSTSEQKPAENVVLAQPATVENCAEDREQATGAANEHPSSFAATLHTLGRRR